ncbi:transcriptional regulator, LacI family [Ligilactobacillus sp. WC1T17]|uniref:Transcriptional regulator, LacI family n=1 Tax=Ligilactobacillus ruminis TaxID=1623 RepID=A0ABY1ACE9_9LACO|nr:transcriptional regulator, LacI family [Ligilactobacillus ruminis]
MRPKLTDVATRAGVSPTTVSRVINNHGYISEKTRQKVMQAMDELNYQPNSLARSLHGKSTHLIGVIFPSITNPFYAELVQHVEERLFNAGYKVILCNSAQDKEKERDYLKMLLANQVDGIIAGAHNLGIEEYNNVGLPIVSFDRHLSDTVPTVSCDNYQGTMLATKALYQAGARHIYFLGNPQKSGNPTDKRLQGYCDAIDELSLSRHTHTVSFTESASLKLYSIRELLTNCHPDGIVCTDDLTALLVLQVAKELQLKVPENLKITGFDGTELIQTYHPELATVIQPLSDIASVLVNVLLSRITNPNGQLAQMEYTLPVTFKNADSI